MDVTSGQAYTFDCNLFDIATPGKFKSSPTLTAGDFVLYRDGALIGNLASLPTASGTVVTVVLSAGEVSGGRLLIIASDADNEWADQSFFLDVRSTARIQKNVAFANFEFLLVLAADHLTPATGLVVTATRSLDGGAFAGCANAVAEVGAGIYKIALAASDLNANVVTLRFTAATAADRFVTILPEP